MMQASTIKKRVKAKEKRAARQGAMVDFKQIQTANSKNQEPATMKRRTIILNEIMIIFSLNVHRTPHRHHKCRTKQ